MWGWWVGGGLVETGLLIWGLWVGGWIQQQHKHTKKRGELTSSLAVAYLSAPFSMRISAISENPFMLEMCKGVILF